MDFTIQNAEASPDSFHGYAVNFTPNRTPALPQFTGLANLSGVFVSTNLGDTYGVGGQVSTLSSSECEPTELSDGKVLFSYRVEEEGNGCR